MTTHFSSRERRWCSNELQSDLFLVCSDGRVAAHTALLADLSKFFADLLASNLACSNCREPTLIQLAGFTTADCRAVISIVYTGFSKLEGTKVERVVSLIRALGLDLGGLVGDVEPHFHQPRFNIQTKGPESTSSVLKLTEISKLLQDEIQQDHGQHRLILPAPPASIASPAEKARRAGAVKTTKPVPELIKNPVGKESRQSVPKSLASSLVQSSPRKRGLNGNPTPSREGLVSAPTSSAGKTASIPSRGSPVSITSGGRNQTPRGRSIPSGGRTAQKSSAKGIAPTSSGGRTVPIPRGTASASTGGGGTLKRSLSPDSKGSKRARVEKETPEKGSNVFVPTGLLECIIDVKQEVEDVISASDQKPPPILQGREADDLREQEKNYMGMNNSRNYVCSSCDTGFTFQRSFDKHKCPLAAKNTTQRNSGARLSNQDHYGANVIADIARSDFEDAIFMDDEGKGAPKSPVKLSPEKKTTTSKKRVSLPGSGEVTKCKYCGRSSPQIEVHCTLHHFKQQILSSFAKDSTCSLCKETHADKNELALHIAFFHTIIHEFDNWVPQLTHEQQEKAALAKSKENAPTVKNSREVSDVKKHDANIEKNSTDEVKSEVPNISDEILSSQPEVIVPQKSTNNAINGKEKVVTAKEDLSQRDAAKRKTEDLPKKKINDSKTVKKVSVTEVKGTTKEKPNSDVKGNAKNVSLKPNFIITRDQAKPGHAKPVTGEKKNVQRQRSKRETPAKMLSPYEPTVQLMSPNLDPSDAFYRRRLSCGWCVKCKLADCGACVVCQDKPVFGGQGKLVNKVCVKKVCRNKS